MRQDYFFGPFRFDSELEIPELAGRPGPGTLAVDIRLGGVPAALVGGMACTAAAEVTASEFLLRIDGVGRFYVADGRLVRVEPVADAALRDLSTYLLGSVFGTLCHQNGLLPLHASTIVHAGGATAFLADSGVGKSTLAACLHRRGHVVASDDICLLAEAGAGDGAGDGMRVLPVGGWFKLWRESLTFLGEQPEEQNRTQTAEDKYRVYLDDAVGLEPRLTNVVFLEREDGAPRLEALSAGATIARMMSMVYATYVPELTGGESRIFRQCARACGAARGFRLVLPWGWDRVEETLDLVERELLGGAAG